jgi:hypothetical protein
MRRAVWVVLALGVTITRVSSNTLLIRRWKKLTRCRPATARDYAHFRLSPRPRAIGNSWLYGREPQYVLMFCISATSKAALEKYRPAFLTMVRSYTSRDEP